MTDKPHTPSTEEVEAFFATLRTTYQVHIDEVIGGDEDRLAEYGQNFDKFMTTRDSRIVAAAEQRGKAEGWDEGYWQGVDDELISASNIGIAGLGMKVQPNRVNPYRADQMEGDE